MSTELVLVTAPGRSLSSDERQRLHARVGEIADQHEGAQANPRMPDSAFTKWFLENDGFFDKACKQAFDDYCAMHQFAPEPLTEELAMSFWLAHEGDELASVTLPRERDVVAALFRDLVQLATAEQLRVSDPQFGKDVNLSLPGELPPSWSAS